MKESTMNEAVEAVARALCEQAGYDPDSLRPGDDPYMNNTPVNDGINAKGDTCHFRWRAYYWQAQAALAAARPFHMEEAAGMVQARYDKAPWNAMGDQFKAAIKDLRTAAKTDGAAHDR